MPPGIDVRLPTRLDTNLSGTCSAPPSAAQPCRSIPWACVYTHPQAERWADSQLRLRGYQTWLPLVTVTRRDRVVRSMRHRVEVPAFPRYLFVRFDAASASWSPIRATPGVSDLVRCGANVAYASPDALEACQTALEARPHQDGKMTVGTAVACSQGPLRGCQAVVTAIHGNRASVAVMMLGHLREVAVSLDNLTSRDD